MDRRDRHGRGMRGPLARPPVPIARSRRDAFEDLVLDAAERTAAFLAADPDDVEAVAALEAATFVVEDMPYFAEGDEPDVVPFGRIEPAHGTTPAVVVIYRRTIELRTDLGDERAELVHDAVIEQIAELLDMDVDDVDPGFDD